MQIEKKVKEIILDIIDENNLKKIDISQITNSTPITDFGFDSLNMAQLTVKIEAEFEVDIFEEKIIRTFGEIIEEIK